VPRIAASSHGETRLRMLRIVHKGDRHDPRDLSVSCRFEGDFSEAFLEGVPGALLPGEALKNLVHTTAREQGHGEIEKFGLALCARVLADHPRVTRARVEIVEQPWNRLEAGGKAQGQAFVAGTPEQRTATVTSNGQQVAVVAGLENLTIMRSSGFGPPRKGLDDGSGKQDGLQRLLVGTLGAKWTYTSGDVTFGPYRQGIRAAIVETFGCHGRRSVQHTLYSIADVVLASYQEIAEVTLSLQERPYRPADLFSAGIENPDDLFVLVDEPLGVVEVTIERD
jgi:urate oxidase